MPEPSQLVLLAQLRITQPGTKVRFLGCVDAYDNQTGQLILCDKHPIEANQPSAVVNIDSILESVNHELLQVGAWLNIIGFVRRASQAGHEARSKNVPNSNKQTKATTIDATMIWSAGAIKLEQYQAAVLEYQQLEP